MRVRDPGDAQAWFEFERRYWPLVFRFFRRQGLRAVDAEDVTQDVFVELARSIRTFQYDRERGRFRDWLGAIIRHALWKRTNSDRRRSDAFTEWEDSTAIDLYEKEEDAEWEDAFIQHVQRIAISRVRRELGEEVFKAFYACWIKDRPPQEVAEEMSRSAGWIYQAKHRFIRRTVFEVIRLAEDVPSLS